MTARNALVFVTSLAGALGASSCQTARPRLEPSADTGPTPPTVHHAIAYGDEAGSARWRVETTFAGIDANVEGLRLRLEDWGEWTASTHTYLRNLESEPPITRDPKRATDFVIRAPANWDGRLRISYEIATAPQSKGHTLLPYRSELYSLGFQKNTLLHLVAGDDPIPSTASLSLVPSGEWTTVTGLGEVGRGKSIRLRGGNTAIVFGRPTDRALALDGSRPVRCWQFGGETPACAQSARVVAKLLAAFEDLRMAIGLTLPDTMTIIIAEGRSGGTGVAGGIIVGYNANLDDDPPEPGVTALIAHELLHKFVPTLEIGENTAVWFHEGFTEYLALWYTAKAGLLEPTAFAQWLESKAKAVATNPAYGQVTFTDPTVRWRDDDGPNEGLAYDGGAIAAFGIDVASRLRGGGGVPDLIRHLHALGPTEVRYEAITSWLSDAGLDSLRQRTFDGPAWLPDVDGALESIGFTRGRRDASLVYSGIETDGGVEAGRVVSIDPLGPAARTELRVGDVIEDYAPRTDTEVHLTETIRTKYRFGLNRLARHSLARLTLRRGESPFVVEYDPWLSGGGWELGLIADGGSVAWFFQ